MTNLDIQIEGDTLIVRVDLSQTHGDSKAGISQIVASSQGNLRLHDGTEYRPEILNMTVTRRKPREEKCW